MLMCDDIISQETGGKQGEQNRNPEMVLLSLPKKRPIGAPSGDYGVANINDTAQTQRETRMPWDGGQRTLGLAKSSHLCHTAIDNLHENQETQICNMGFFFFNSRNKSFLHYFEHLSWEGTREIRVKNVGSNSD